jgi:hypothetical protein
MNWHALSMKSAYKILVTSMEQTPERLWYRSVNNVKLHLKWRGCENMHSIRLAVDIIQWRAYVNTELNYQVSQGGSISCLAQQTSFSTNVLHGIHCVQNAKYLYYDVVRTDTVKFSNLWKLHVGTFMENNPFFTDDDCEKALFWIKKKSG